MKRIASLLGVVVSLSSSIALADVPADAWAAAKTRLPAAPMLIGSANIQTLKGSSVFATFYSKALAESPEVSRWMSGAKTHCGIDLVDAVRGVAFAADDRGSGVFFFSTSGLTPEALGDCVKKVATAQNPKAMFADTKPDTTGTIDLYDGTAHVYLAALPNGVFALASNPGDKALLQKWMGGKGVPVTSEAGKALAAIDTNASVWAVVNKSAPIPPIGAAGSPGVMNLAYGTATVAAGRIAGAATVVTSSAKAATKVATTANAELTKVQQGKVSPVISTVLKGLKVGATGSNVTVNISTSEKDAIALFYAFVGK